MSRDVVSGADQSFEACGILLEWLRSLGSHIHRVINESLHKASHISAYDNKLVAQFKKKLEDFRVQLREFSVLFKVNGRSLFKRKRQMESTASTISMGKGSSKSAKEDPVLSSSLFQLLEKKLISSSQLSISFSVLDGEVPVLQTRRTALIDGLKFLNQLHCFLRELMR